MPAPAASISLASRADALAQRQSGPVEELVERLTRLPSIGRKTAHRLAYYLLKAAPDESHELAAAILRLRERIRPCSICHNHSELDPCAVCADPSRDPQLLCIVEEGHDVAAIERTHQFRGHYHVLGGALSPLDNVGPDSLHLDDLAERVRASGVKEVILATNPTVEGEATAAFVARLLKPLQVTLSRIAAGIPIGGDLEYADEVTMSHALEGRRQL